MSYSFTVRADSKAKAKALVAEELDKVVAQQPVHAADRAQALAAVEAYIDIVADNETTEADSKDLVVSVNGSVGWQHPDQSRLTSSAVGIAAYLTPKETR